MLNTWQISRSAASIFGKVAGPSEKGRQGCLKVRCSKRCFDIFWNPLRVGPIFKFYKINSLKNYLCIWKVPIIKIVLLVKNLPRFFNMTCFTEIFQIQNLSLFLNHAIIPFDEYWSFLQTHSSLSLLFDISGLETP